MSTQSLSSAQVARLRSVVDLCATPAVEPMATAWQALGELESLVGCDVVAFNGVDPARRRHYHRQVWASGERWLPSLPDSEAHTAFWHLYDSSPMCSHPDQLTQRAVLSPEDVGTRSEWLTHPIHREVNPAVTDELMVAVPDGGGRTLRVIFFRLGGRTFADSDHFALTLLAPHLEPLLLAARTAAPPARPALTGRQWQILEQVRLGRANKQIARDLAVAPGTVRKHLENIFRSLEVQSRGAAVHVAFGDTDGPFHEVAS